MAAAAAASVAAVAVCEPFFCSGRHARGISPGKVMRGDISSGKVMRGTSSTHNDGPLSARGEADASFIEEVALRLTYTAAVPVEARRGLLLEA